MFAAARALTALCLVGILSGCAADSSIATTKAKDYAGSVKRLLIFSYVSGDYPAEFSDAFDAELVRIAEDCGIASKVSTAKLGSPEAVGAVREFRPDGVLGITRTEGWMRADTKTLIERTYDVQLVDIASGRVVWRANAVFRRGPAWYALADRARTLATELTTRLKADGLLKSCPPSSPPS